ncbi:uncharacterized protein ABDE67_017389 [Symphorus nematophorus]
MVVVLLLLGIGYFIWRRQGRGAGIMVQFSNRFGGVVKQDTDERSNAVYDGRDGNTQVNERANNRGLEEKKADVDSDNAVERVPEDLAGRLTYELEPLVLS